jgi:magnesium transporter
MSTQPNSDLRPTVDEVQPWLSVDSTGDAHVFKAGELDIMRRTGLTLRDLRKIIDPLFSSPCAYSTILGRERAIIVNLEPIQAIITADEVLLKDPSFVQELQERVRNHDSTTTPFEFAVLEACLEAACSGLEKEAKMIEQEAHTPSLDELKSKTSTELLNNLEGLYKLMSRLVEITNRVQIVKEGLGYFLFDESNMATYSTANDKFVVKELKMLLEAYYFQILSTLNKLSKVPF